MTETGEECGPKRSGGRIEAGVGTARRIAAERRREFFDRHNTNLMAGGYSESLKRYNSRMLRFNHVFKAEADRFPGR